MLIKTITIDAKVPVRTVTPPIYGYHANIRMNTSDILKCIIKRALITETLSNGQTIKLNMTNYFIDYEGELATEKPAVETAPVVEPDVEEAPVEVVVEPVVETAVEEAPVEEQPTMTSGVVEVIYTDGTTPVDETSVADAPTATTVASKPENTSNKSNKSHKK